MQPSFSSFSQADLDAAIERIRAGGLVAFPTETVYGLGADALNEAAVRRVFEAKGRPANNPLIVHVSGPEMARPLVRKGGWTSQADILARAFWPGPLTLVLDKSDGVPDAVTAGGTSVALRCPDHPLTLALLFRLQRPLVGPSANRSGHVSPTTAAHVRAEFAENEVMILDGGQAAGRVGIESTVLSLTGPEGRPRVLRPGMIAPDEIAGALGIRVEDVEVGAAHAATGSPLESPGMLARHYAPRTPARLLTAQELAGALAPRPDAPPAPLAVLVLTLDPEIVAGAARLFRMPRDPEAYAAALYPTLHGADEAGVKEILIEDPSPLAAASNPHDRALWEAVLDRLRRASSPG